MFKRILLILSVAVFLLGNNGCLGEAAARSGPPQERPSAFLELWNNISYYDTNIERKGFASILGRYEGKAGLNLFNSPLQVYGVYYGVASQDNAYWNNAVLGGAGARFTPFESYAASGWLDEWIRDLKIYAESLSSSYFKNAASAEAANLATRDTQYGLEVWHEWNLDRPDESIPWAELWAKLSFRRTNFGWEDFNNYILYLQQKVGRHLGRGVEAYLRADVTLSGKGGTSYYFLNVADYGVGVRVEPWRQSAAGNDLFRKFKMFVEMVAVSYLKDRPSNPVASDLRFGIDFSFGAVGR